MRASDWRASSARYARSPPAAGSRPRRPASGAAPQLVRLQRARRRLRRGRRGLQQAGRGAATRSSYVRAAHRRRPAARADRPAARGRGLGHRPRGHGRDLDRRVRRGRVDQAVGGRPTAQRRTEGKLEGPLRDRASTRTRSGRSRSPPTPSCSGTARTGSKSRPETWDEMIDAGREARREGRSRCRRASYEGYTVWFNSLVASRRRARSSTRTATSKVDASATRGRGDHRKLADRQGRARRACPTTRRTRRGLGFETGRSSFLVNYPFIYPSAPRRERGASEEHRLGALPARRPGQAEQARRSAASTSASAPTRRTRTWPSRPPECLAQPENQVVGRRDGRPAAHHRVRSTTTRRSRRRSPFADLLRESIDDGAPRPVDAGLQRHLAGDPEDLPPARRASTRTTSSTSCRTGSSKAAEGKIF